MHGRTRMAIDPCIPTIPGRSASGFHGLGRYYLHEAQSVVKYCSRRVASTLSCFLLGAACEEDFVAYG